MNGTSGKAVAKASFGGIKVMGRDLFIAFVLSAFGSIAVSVTLPSSASAAPPAFVADTHASQQSLVPRPPQFVAFAFDGSLELRRWEETRAFAAEMNKSGVPFHFTYFISGVYFLETARADQYKGPHHDAGASNIDFGGLGESIVTRVQELNAAAREGHEIGSHLNGHFDGSDWSLADWNQEFTAFMSLIFDVFKNNDLVAPDGIWAITPASIRGFRAPYLAVNEKLWESLRQNKFRYDTSDVEPSDTWPDHAKGFWSYPLAELRIAGSGKRTLSMDYNFYVAQSGAVEDPANSALYEKQMYETYLNYFMTNYNGNRAPVNIGHHFPLFNGGAYWRAMMSFARAVCGLAEVKCVTYSELSDFMDKVDGPTLEAYRQGRFEKLTPIKLALDLPKPTRRQLATPLSELEKRALLGDMPEAHQAFQLE